MVYPNDTAKENMKSGTLQPSLWFFLRGLAREAAHWGSFVENFTRAVPGAHVVCLDLPGCGQHRNLQSPLDIPSIASFVRAHFLQQCQLYPTYPRYVLATSLGAMVAVDWLHAHPKDFAGAVLMNTSFKGLSPFYRRLWFEAYPYIVKALKEKNVPKRESEILRMVSNHLDKRDAALAHWIQIQEERPVTHMTFFRQILAAARYTPELSAPQVPVLLLSSMRDRMVHPSCSEAIYQLWHCDLKRHPTAGHDLTLDDSEWVLKAVNAWLQGQSN